MSAQRFTRKGRSYGLGAPPACAMSACHSSGLYRWEIAGYVQGLVCGRHRNELQRAWENARTTTMGEAA